MKKLLLFSLALLLFVTGCAPAKEDKSAENTTEAPQTVEPADADPTETPDATPGPQAEPPYKDAREMYTSVMTNERDKSGELLPDEIRLTKFGRLLRSTSLDELPSLINIFN